MTPLPLQYDSCSCFRYIPSFNHDTCSNGLYTGINRTTSWGNETCQGVDFIMINFDSLVILVIGVGGLVIGSGGLVYVIKKQQRSQMER